MKPLLISKAQLVWSLISVTAGCILWMTLPRPFDLFAILFITTPIQLMQPRDDGTQPAPRKQWGLIICIMASLFALIFLTMFVFHLFDYKGVMYVLKHPLLIVSLWLFANWRAIKRWKLGQSQLSTTPPDAQSGS